MAAIVIVSHSKKLAEGVADICKMAAHSQIVYSVGGLEDGSFGTDYQRIESILRTVDNSEGVIVFADLGSSVMTAEMAIENIGSDTIKIADCPMVEGAVMAAVLSSAGVDTDTIMKELDTVAQQKKLS